MNNKDISVLTKIKWSLLFPISILVHWILFLCDKSKQEREFRRGKRWWYDIIYNIREEFEKDKFTVIGYSFIPLTLLTIIYILLCCVFNEWNWNFIPCISAKKFQSIVFIVGILLVSIIIAKKSTKETKGNETVKEFEHSFFFLILVSVIYILLCCIFVVWCRSPITFFAIVLAIGSLLISIIIALELRKKKIGSGVQFLNQLLIHINYLSNFADKHDLYIISPNINIGVLLNKSIGDVITQNTNINFNFLCKSINTKYLDNYKDSMDSSEKHKFFEEANKNDSEMLFYLYKRYEDTGKLDALVTELKQIVKCSHVHLIQKYDEGFELKKIDNSKEQNKALNIKKMDDSGEQNKLMNRLTKIDIIGYLSDWECVFGRYIDIKEQRKDKNGEEHKIVDPEKVLFYGEIITSFEFIEFVKKQIKEIEMKTIKKGRQFVEHLSKHAENLNLETRDEKHKLYIITPNITIGYGGNINFIDTIKKCQNVQFFFICKTICDNSLEQYDKADNKRTFLEGVDKVINSMLDYIYRKYYRNDQDEFDKLMEILRQMLEIKNNNGNIKIIQKYDEICKGQRIGAYLSDKECVFGIYEDTEKNTGEIRFRGEIIRSPDVIDLIKIGIGIQGQDAVTN